MDKPRKWWIAGLLSFIRPGLGQLYNGQPYKAVFIFILPIIFYFALVSALWTENILGLLGSLLAAIVLFYVLVFVDAVRVAIKFKSRYELKRYNKVIFYLAVVVLVGVINAPLPNYIRSNYIQAFKMPSAGNEPTILVGDYILVDRRESARNPVRGDMVVFEFPGDPQKDFVQRVVAVEGDIVEVREKDLIINGNIIDEEYAVHNDTNIIPKGRVNRDFYGPETVPENSYFVMGDNRDRSHDSRFWGFVDRTKIKGTVDKVYWSWDRLNKIVRWSRIGAKFDR